MFEELSCEAKLDSHVNSRGELDSSKQSPLPGSCSTLLHGCCTSSPDFPCCCSSGFTPAFISPLARVPWSLPVTWQIPAPLKRLGSAQALTPPPPAPPQARRLLWDPMSPLTLWLDLASPTKQTSCGAGACGVCLSPTSQHGPHQLSFVHENPSTYSLYQTPWSVGTIV